MSISIGVIIPAYGRAVELDAALASVLLNVLFNGAGATEEELRDAALAGGEH